MAPPRATRPLKLRPDPRRRWPASVLAEVAAILAITSALSATLTLGCNGDATMLGSAGATGGAPRSVALRSRCPESVEIWVGVDPPSEGASRGRHRRHVVGAGREIDVDLVGKQRIWLRASFGDEHPKFTSTPATHDGEELEIDSGCRHFLTTPQAQHTP